MKKRNIIWLVISAVIMFWLPLTAVLFAGSAGMAICFILFYAVNPLYSLIIGCVAGKCPKRLWALPLLNAVFFLISAWLLFDMGESAFVLYASVYLILGIIAMFISWIVYRKFVV